MKTTAYKIVLMILAVILLGRVILPVYQNKKGAAMVSEFGKYQGYAQKEYDGNQRISQYLTLANGTKLAYDLFLPTQKGVATSQALPVLFRYTPYGRAWAIYDEQGHNLMTGLVDLDWFTQAMLRLRYTLSKDRGRLFDALFHDRWLEVMVNQGYAVIVVERPGTGASSGLFNGDFKAVAEEEDQILNWITAQAWCNGKIGMYGDSQNAMVQLVAASLGNPHLKAILPASSPVDMYDSIMFPGGVFNKSFFAFSQTSISYLEKLYVPVDSDKDGSQLAQVRQERLGKTKAERLAVSKDYVYHDSRIPMGTQIWQVTALYPYIVDVNRFGTAVYMMVGWYDIFTADMFYWYNNLNTPKRLTVRPTDHSNVQSAQADLNFGLEAQRWFDYWLKGIDNGIMQEPPIHYYLQGAPKSKAWQAASQWPLASRKPAAYYFDRGRTGSVASANDGLLTTQPPMVQIGCDAYTVDYTTTTGKGARWTAVEQAHHYPDMRTNDAKALTYTTSPLVEDLEITGHPVAHIWLSTAAPDLDVFVYLEEVAANGKSTYVTEGVLRATHRKLGAAPFDALGLPFHTHNQSDLEPVLAGQPFEVDLSLLPSAYRFHKGSSLRITVAFADADNFETPILTPAPSLNIWRDASHPSYVELPVVQ